VIKSGNDVTRHTSVASSLSAGRDGRRPDDPGQWAGPTPLLPASHLPGADDVTSGGDVVKLVLDTPEAARP